MSIYFKLSERTAEVHILQNENDQLKKLSIKKRWSNSCPDVHIVQSAYMRNALKLIKTVVERPVDK